MKTIEERAKEWGEHIVETTPYDVVDGKACVFVEDRNIADVAEESYIAGATEQKAIDEAIRLKKCDDMTEAEYNREVAFIDWFYENSSGTITHSDAIEWARKKIIDDAELVEVKSERDEYYDELTKLRRQKIELIEWLKEEASWCREHVKTGYDAYEIGTLEGIYTQAEETIKKIKAMEE